MQPKYRFTSEEMERIDSKKLISDHRYNKNKTTPVSLHLSDIEY